MSQNHAAELRNALESHVKASKRKRAVGMSAHRRAKAARPTPMIAYDFETTSIAAGTPDPVYLTAFGLNPQIDFETPIRDLMHLRAVLQTTFLTAEYDGVSFVAWNGNNFDAYFVACALVECEGYLLRPYLTRSNALRGLRVTEIFTDSDGVEYEGNSWQFLDGMAMLGLATVSLAKFLANFAPQYKKLEGTIDFDAGEKFDATNPKHREYAMRDSVGLYHGMVRAQNILMERFDAPLAVTMGGCCIKIFKAHIPPDAKIKTPRDEVLDLTREYVMRGGFCFCVRRYKGPIWKYDINQAYAAAMREAELPAGFTMHCEVGLPSDAGVYIARCTASKPGNKIPFYYRTEDSRGALRSKFAETEITETWLTSIEINQLRAEGWKVAITESYCWESSFNMSAYVDSLENMRMTCEGGPSGAIGIMLKMVGNHSYGKTVEQLEPIEYVMGATCPPGFLPFYGDGFEPMDHVYYRLVPDEEVHPKDYHQPQIGAFITAHVRMKVRRAALLAPDDWLYADTDCVVFSRDVTSRLDIDPARYGAWKIEEDGTEFRVIAKKVYAQVAVEGPHKPGSLKNSAKGLHVKKLHAWDFEQWYEGRAPMQHQVQRNNFIRVVQGAEMFRDQERSGTRVQGLTPG